MKIAKILTQPFRASAISRRLHSKNFMQHVKTAAFLPFTCKILRPHLRKILGTIYLLAVAPLFE